MPAISWFYGMVIAMYYNDHEPSHFHVRYGDQKAIVSIDPVTLIAGDLSARAYALVSEWATLHQQELRTNWQLARRYAPLKPIAPLD